MSLSPDPKAVASMAGFDDLPPAFRDLLNYSPVTMQPTSPSSYPCRTVLSLIDRHGAAKVQVALISALGIAAADPDRFRDTKTANR